MFWVHLLHQQFLPRWIKNKLLTKMEKTSWHPHLRTYLILMHIKYINQNFRATMIFLRTTSWWLLSQETSCNRIRLIKAIIKLAIIYSKYLPRPRKKEATGKGLERTEIKWINWRLNTTRILNGHVNMSSNSLKNLTLLLLKFISGIGINQKS